MTADDVYLLPIAGAKLYFHGLEDQFVLTDAQGCFTLTSVPAGNVKLVIDGMTATNAPAGIYFPEMVMDLDIKPGVVNTVMADMQPTAEEAAAAIEMGVYLPRIRTAILQNVDNNGATHISLGVESAPGLTPEQQSFLTIDVQPNSLIAPDGQRLASGQVGISLVPPELVMDMLPPGVLQHTFDITVQAPGIDRFSTPAPMTFPNTFNAAPGTQLDFLSFDHTTGRLVIEGTATVSPDGKSVTTDPGTGITHPGWHGLAPAGSPSDPPCDPTTPHFVDVDPIPVTFGLADYLFKDDSGSFTYGFGNAAAKIFPFLDPCHPNNITATPLIVEVTVEGPKDDFLDDFIKGHNRQILMLQPGQQQTFKVEVKDLLGGIQSINVDRLYGAKVTVKGYKSSDPGKLLIDKKFYVYRFLDAADSDHTHGVVEMADTANDGGEVLRGCGQSIITPGQRCPRWKLPTPEIFPIPDFQTSSSSIPSRRVRTCSPSCASRTPMAIWSGR